MNGGTLRDNEAGWGGGVYANSTTNLAGGIITGNKIWEQDRDDGSGKERPKRGAGVYYEGTRDNFIHTGTAVMGNNPDNIYPEGLLD